LLNCSQCRFAVAFGPVIPGRRSIRNDNFVS
jgi:hypothetical protein